MKKFWARLTQWEYWPFELFYAPVFFYYLFLAIKNRSFFFFTASNPSIECGGMFGEKKWDILSLIPDSFLPSTFLIKKGELLKALEVGNEIGYPLIAKPNVGERGNWVKKIESEGQLRSYVENCRVDFLMQELVDYQIELGVFYVRKPSEKKGKVTSIVRKNFLSVTGDGKSTINELLERNERALLTADLESEYLRKVGDDILLDGAKVVIEPIGNHCRGTQFLNDNHEINEKLIAAFDTLAQQIPDFYYGRFDLKCKSYDDLAELKNFKIMELNGAGAEPAHVYHPGYSLFRAYKDILWHFHVLGDISAENRKRGFRYWSLKEGYRNWKAYKNYYQLLSVK